MKLRGFFLTMLFIASFTFFSCNEEEVITPEVITKHTAKLGAQSNTTIGSFLSISEHKVYMLADAFANQAKIDVICFYELTDQNPNYTTVAGPGSNITGIFTGAYDFPNWTTKNVSLFTLPATAITVAQYDALKDGDTVIESYFNAALTSGNKKMKNLTKDMIFAFKTAGGKFVIAKVLAVEQGATGFAEIEYKVK